MSQSLMIQELPVSTIPLLRETRRTLKFKMDPTCNMKEEEIVRKDYPHHIEPCWKPIDPHERPPYPFAALIAHALLSSTEGRLTLSSIYKWISETYPYFQLGKKSWQNSIRHNLSVYKDHFKRVDRRPTLADPGKGGYWQIEIHMEKYFIDILSKPDIHGRKMPNLMPTAHRAMDKQGYDSMIVKGTDDFKTKKIRFKQVLVTSGRPSLENRKRRHKGESSCSTKISKAKTMPKYNKGNAQPLVPQDIDHFTKPSESSGLFDESMLLNDYTFLLEDRQPTETKIINLQSLSMEKSLHYPTSFSVNDFIDPSSKFYIPDFSSYQIDQYIDPLFTMNDFDFQFDQDSVIDCNFCSDPLFDIPNFDPMF